MVVQMTYGGIPLATNAKELQQLMESWLPGPELPVLARERPYPAGLGLQGISQVFRHKDNTPMLGCASWPPFATRWGRADFLIGQEQIDQLLPLAFNVDAGPLAQTLTLEQADASVSLPMVLLPPKPIAKFGAFPGCYLLNFVDIRYFWRFRYTNFVIDDSVSWQDLIDQLATDLGVTLSNSIIDAVYGQPIPQSINYENSAFWLDCVAWNLGRTVAANFDGTFALLTNEESEALVSLPEAHLAGGDFNDLDDILASPKGGVLLPQHVLVSFPRRLTTGDYVINNYYTKDITLGAAGLGDYFGVPGTKVFHDTAEGWVAEAGDTPTNQAQLDALALQIAQDFYTQQLDGVDESFPGILPAAPEGVHDLCWYWTHNNCYTRISTQPYNLEVEELLHHFPVPIDTECCPDLAETLYAVITTENCDCGGSFEVQLDYDSDSGSWVGTETFGDCSDATITLTLACEGSTCNDFNLHVHFSDDCSNGDATLDACSCDDETFTFHYDLGAVCGCSSGGTIGIGITPTPSVVVGCCASPVPTVLHATLTNVTDAACVDGLTFDLTYQEIILGLNYWVGCVALPDGNLLRVGLRCELVSMVWTWLMDQVLEITPAGNCVNPVGFDTLLGSLGQTLGTNVCYPFDQVWTVTGFYSVSPCTGCCVTVGSGTQFTVTINA